MDTLQIGLAIVAATFAAAVTFTKANSGPVDPSSGNAMIIAGEELPEAQGAFVARRQISPGVINGHTGKAAGSGMHGERLAQMADQGFAVGFGD